jgi:diphthine synthase
VLRYQFFVVCTHETLAVGVARLGYDDEVIITGTLDELLKADFGAPLHCMVMIGDMHFLEKQVVGGFAVDAESWKNKTQHVKE